MGFKRTFITITIGPLTYILLKKIFPGAKKKKDINDEKIPRGGDNTIVDAVFEKISENFPVIGGIFSTFAAHYVFQFNKEIAAILTNATIATHAGFGKTKLSSVVRDVTEKCCAGDVKGELVCDGFNNLMTTEEKIFLVKEKLKAILFGKYPNKKKLMIFFLLGILAACFTSQVVGMTITLSALRALLEEGKLSEALYEELVEAVKNSDTSPDIL